MTMEEQRLEESRDRNSHWKRWGPYLSERAWGTVREDYSADGTAWEYFPTTTRICAPTAGARTASPASATVTSDLCFALAFWNGRDPILKERLFGLTGNEGNHGEDVKECYYYLDSTPTHSYMKCLYKYPQDEFPYQRLRRGEPAPRTQQDPEFELIDTGVFDENRYFDIFVEYAKAGPDDILIRITAANRGPEPATLHLLPTLWFRNTWSWGHRRREARIAALRGRRPRSIWMSRSTATLDPDLRNGRPPLLFTENETKRAALWNSATGRRTSKDAINDYVIHGEQRRCESRADAAPRPAPGITSTIAPGRDSDHPAAPHRCAHRADADGTGRSTNVRRANPRSRRILCHRHSAGIFPPTRRTSCGRPSPGCSGPSSFITTSCETG